MATKMGETFDELVEVSGVRERCSEEEWLGVGCQQWRDLFVGGVRETYTGWRRRRHGGGLRGRRKGRRSERSVTLYNFLAARVQRG